MRGPLPRLLALPLTAALLLLPAVPAVADDADDDSTIPTTPVPEHEGEAPASKENDPAPTARAIGAAGTALGALRLLPESQDTETILPGFSDELGKQAALEAGISLSSAKVDSEAYLSYERSVAEACPGGIAIGGDAPRLPGCVSQNALPDNEEATTTGLDTPENPLLNIGLLDGTAHARWDPEEGACVEPIADSSESLASLSLLPEIPSMGDITELSGSSDELAGALDNTGPLETLGGLLPGKTGDDDTGGLLNMPNTMSTRSNVRLVDIPDSDNKAVQSTSTLQLADVHLLEGTPLGINIKVVSQPTLTVTSTGDPETSTVDYEAPVLDVYQNGEKQFSLDADNPTESIDVGLPSNPAKLAESMDLPTAADLKDVPVVGGLAETVDDGVRALDNDDQGMVLDLLAIKLSIADLDVDKTSKEEPFDGYQLGASAHMMNVDILPTDRLADILPPDLGDELPASLAQVAFGEQVARAYAPDEGVVCGTSGGGPPGEDSGGGGESPGTPDQLAQTSAAYASVPIFWTGTGLLLAGVVMVSALPNRRNTVRSGPKPSPRPRE